MIIDNSKYFWIYPHMFNQTDSVETIQNSFQSITKEFPADIQSSDVLL